MKIQKYHKRKLINIATTAVSAITNISVTWSMKAASDMSIETSWGANLTGTFAFLQKNAGSYRAVTNVTLANPAASASGEVANIIDAGATDYKITFARTSGTTGPLETWLIIKNFD